MELQLEGADLSAWAKSFQRSRRPTIHKNQVGINGKTTGLCLVDALIHRRRPVLFFCFLVGGGSCSSKLLREV